MTSAAPPKRIFPDVQGRRTRRRARAVDPSDRKPGVQARLPGHRIPASRGSPAGPFPARAAQARAACSNEANIGSTFVFYGSARIPSPEMADALIEAATNDQQRTIAERLKAKSHYYEVARELARLASRCDCDEDGKRHFVVCSGGGPSIMEAANRGAVDEGEKSIGLNIVLPHEQLPEPLRHPGTCFQFHYFALRKMHFCCARGRWRCSPAALARSTKCSSS